MLDDKLLSHRGLWIKIALVSWSIKTTINGVRTKLKHAIDDESIVSNTNIFLIKHAHLKYK